MTFETNYQSFTIKNTLTIYQGKGDFPYIKIDNEHATALISIYGAQLLAYTPKKDNKTTEKDLFFVSDSAYFEKGKAIKGGIPICWPWFGKDPENKSKPMHGFARNNLWKLEQTSQTETGDTQVILSLSDTDEICELWPFHFKLLLTINIGCSLSLSLKTINTDQKPFTITQALHSYFSVADIDEIHLEGLDGISFLDKVTNSDQPEVHHGDVTITEEVDRIFTDAPAEISLHDKKLKRRIDIRSRGSKTIVVWNPWIALSKKSNDLADDDYRYFICVETANANQDIIKIEPDRTYTISAEYTLF